MLYFQEGVKLRMILRPKMNLWKIAASEKYKTWLLAHHLVKARVPELSNKVPPGVSSFIAANTFTGD